MRPRTERADPITLYRYGDTLTTAGPGLGDYATPADEMVEVVPASELREASRPLPPTSGVNGLELHVVLGAGTVGAIAAVVTVWIRRRIRKPPADQGPDR